jgi:pimeloyl-ACP methyl ester carboxylesterase
VIKESVVRFGPQAALVGVLTDPDPSVAVAGAPAVLLLTAGFLHRVGPHRLHVDLARRLAEAGYPALRFDMAGVGDSSLPSGIGPDDVRSVDDVRAAMDHLAERRRAERFVLIGLCSGAGAAYETAIADPRVSCSILLDGPAYPTLGYRLRYYAARLRDPDRVRGFIERRIKRALGAFGLQGDSARSEAGPSSTSDAAPVVFELSIPPRAEVERRLNDLARRGTAVLFVYTGEHDGYLYDRQFREMFPRLDPRGLIEHRYLSRSDHTFTPLEDRRDLIHTVVEFVSSRR